MNQAFPQSYSEEVLYDLESERRVLSSMLHSEEACVEAYHLLTALDFYSPRHATIFELISSLFERDIRPTYVELLKEGHSLGILTNPRDIEEIKYIAEHYIDDENIRYWVKRVKDKSRLRKFESFLRRSTQVLVEGKDLEADDILMAAEEELTNLTALDVDDNIDTPADVATLGYQEVERRFLQFKEIREKYRGVMPLYGLPTGFDDLNHITLGYKPGDLIILGAQTGHGKTTFALHAARSVAVDHNSTVLYLNTEMSREQIALRWGSILSGIEHDKIRSGDINENELSVILKGYSRLRESGFYSYPARI